MECIWWEPSPAIILCNKQNALHLFNSFKWLFPGIQSVAPENCDDFIRYWNAAICRMACTGHCLTGLGSPIPRHTMKNNLIVNTSVILGGQNVTARDEKVSQDGKMNQQCASESCCGILPLSATRGQDLLSWKYSVHLNKARGGEPGSRLSIALCTISLSTPFPINIVQWRNPLLCKQLWRTHDVFYWLQYLNAASMSFTANAPTDEISQRGINLSGNNCWWKVLIFAELSFKRKGAEQWKYLIAVNKTGLFFLKNITDLL